MSRCGKPSRSPEEYATVTERVTYAIADREGVSPADLDAVLFEAIDPDALNAIVRSLPDTADTGRVVFSYAGYTVTVESDGTVHLDQTE